MAYCIAVRWTINPGEEQRVRELGAGGVEGGAEGVRFEGHCVPLRLQEAEQPRHGGGGGRAGLDGRPRHDGEQVVQGKRGVGDGVGAGVL